MNRVVPALGALTLLALGARGQEIQNRIDVAVPEKSMLRLVELAYAEAEAVKLPVKAITFSTAFHPIDNAVAVVEFKERPLGGDVYEFTKLLLANSAWPPRDSVRPVTEGYHVVPCDDYLAQLPPASPKWRAWEPPWKTRKLKLTIQGELVFVAFRDNVPPQDVGTYVEKFVAWAKTRPGPPPPGGPMTIRASEISSVSFNKEEQTVEISNCLSERACTGIRCTSYTFDISGGNFRFVEESRVVS